MAGSEQAGPALGGVATRLPVAVSEANGAAPPGTEAPVGRTEDRHAGAALVTNANDLQHSGAVRVPPILGVPGRVKRGARVPARGSNGWELPARRAWYGVNDGRRPRLGRSAREGPVGLPSPRVVAGGVGVSAANRPVSARPWGRREGTQEVVGPNPRKAHVHIPPVRGRGVPALACYLPGRARVGPGCSAEHHGSSTCPGGAAPVRHGINKRTAPHGHVPKASQGQPPTAGSDVERTSRAVGRDTSSTTGNR